MNNKILKEKILALLAHQDDDATLESVYALLKPRFEKAKGAKCQKRLVLTDRQRECIERAVTAKLIEKLPDGTLRWLHPKVLLAYFCGRVYCGDYTKTGVDGKEYWKCGEGQFPGLPLERLFNVKNLRQRRNDRFWVAPPEDHELVDEILFFLTLS